MATNIEPLSTLEKALATIKKKGDGAKIARGPWSEPFGVRRKTTQMVELECKNGHRWIRQLQCVANGRFRCVDCLTVTEEKVRAKILADHPTAEILSGLWIDNTMVQRTIRITLKCDSCFNVWSPDARNIISGSWCPKNSCKQNGPGVTLTFEMFKEYVESRGGSVHPDSPPYVNGLTKMLVSCNFNNHEPFETYFSHANRGKWCPSCFGSGSICEEVCRQTLVEAFGKKFNKTRRLEWLKTAEGARMEIDCYDEELKIGVEYNGAQHYTEIKQWHRDDSAFQRQQERDKVKRQLCEEHGLTLIEVPYTVHIDKIRDFLREKIIELRPELSLFPVQTTDPKEFVQKVRALGPPKQHKYNEIVELVQGGNTPKGTVVSTQYFGCTTNMIFKCIKPEHPDEFALTPESIRKGGFCPKCAIDTQRRSVIISDEIVSQRLLKHELTYIPGHDQYILVKKTNRRHITVQCKHKHSPYLVDFNSASYRKPTGFNQCPECVELGHCKQYVPRKRRTPAEIAADLDKARV